MKKLTLLIAFFIIMLKLNASIGVVWGNSLSEKVVSSKCVNPVSITLPFEKEGSGEFCYVTSEELSLIQSWNCEKVVINGVDITNDYTTSFPDKIDGKYKIYFKGQFEWSHLEIKGTGSSTNEYKLTTAIEGEGELNLSGGKYPEGTQLTITATARQGWKFKEWKGAANGTENPMHLSMDSDKHIIAVFISDNTNTCSFVFPSSSPLPTLNKDYEHIHIIGNGPDLYNVFNLSINWNLERKELYNFSINTMDGEPSWYINLQELQSNSLESPEPWIKLEGTGFNKGENPTLDGEYEVLAYKGDFVMSRKNGDFILYFSNSPSHPCHKGYTNNRQQLIDEEDIKVYPIPFKKEITVSYNTKLEIYSIALYTMLGQKIAEKIPQERTQTEIILSVPNEGKVFMLQLITNKGLISKTLIR